MQSLYWLSPCCVNHYPNPSGLLNNMIYTGIRWIHYELLCNHKGISWYYSYDIHKHREGCVANFTKIPVTGCTGSCHNGNFQCSQWLKFHQNDDISVSLKVTLKCSMGFPSSEHTSPHWQIWEEETARWLRKTLTQVLFAIYSKCVNSALFLKVYSQVLICHNKKISL